MKRATFRRTAGLSKPPPLGEGEARNAPTFLSGGRLCSARRSRGRERDAENVMQTVAPRRKFVYNEPVRQACRGGRQCRSVRFSERSFVRRPRSPHQSTGQKIRFRNRSKAGARQKSSAPIPHRRRQCRGECKRRTFRPENHPKIICKQIHIKRPGIRRVGKRCCYGKGKKRSPRPSQMEDRGHF